MTQPLKDKTVLIVADDANARDLLLQVLQEAGANVVKSRSVESTMAELMARELEELLTG